MKHRGKVRHEVERDSRKVSLRHLMPMGRKEAHRALGEHSVVTHMFNILTMVMLPGCTQVRLIAAYILNIIHASHGKSVTNK